MISKNKTIAQRSLEFSKELADTTLELPSPYELLNPFSAKEDEEKYSVLKNFYEKYYGDDNPRRLILGSSPSRRGSVLFGIPFADPAQLMLGQQNTSDSYLVSKGSADFLENVIEEFGGYQSFFNSFLMNFVCPLGIVRRNDKGRFVNANYYENGKLQKSLDEFMVSSVKSLASIAGDTSVCYCIGTSGNLNFLNKINDEMRIFGKIIALEHPRYITQYHSDKKSFYLEKYMGALTH